MSREEQDLVRNSTDHVNIVSVADSRKSKCVCRDVGNGKYRCFKMVLGNWQDCGFGEFDSLQECQDATGCSSS